MRSDATQERPGCFFCIRMLDAEVGFIVHPAMVFAEAFANCSEAVREGIKLVHIHQWLIASDEHGTR
jgi:hypothetical protein